MTCLIRELSSLWSWLKLRLSPLAAVYSFTGNETRPNVIWPFQIVAATRIPSARAALSPQHQQISAASQTFSSGCVGRGKSSAVGRFGEEPIDSAAKQSNIRSNAGALKDSA